MDAKKEIVEKEKTIKDFADIQDLIGKIEAVLQAPRFDIYQARHIIGKVNEKHGENITAYKIATRQFIGNTGNESSIAVRDAGPDALKQDLQWKHFYLNAKLRAKTVEEIEKEWQKLRN